MEVKRVTASSGKATDHARRRRRRRDLAKKELLCNKSHFCDPYVVSATTRTRLPLNYIIIYNEEVDRWDFGGGA